MLVRLRRFEEALAAYDQAIALDPSHASDHSNRGLVLVRLKRFGDALAAYHQAIAVRRPGWETTRQHARRGWRAIYGPMPRQRGNRAK